MILGLLTGRLPQSPSPQGIEIGTLVRVTIGGRPAEAHAHSCRIEPTRRATRTQTGGGAALGANPLPVTQENPDNTDAQALLPLNPQLRLKPRTQALFCVSLALFCVSLARRRQSEGSRKCFNPKGCGNVTIRRVAGMLQSEGLRE